MSTELKQLFHSPEDFSDAELDIMRVKLQNQRRIPRIATVFGIAGAAVAEGIFLRRSPRMMTMLIGAGAGYAFGGYGASTSLNANMLARKFDFDIIMANERRQLRRTMNLAGYGQEHIGAHSTNANVSHSRPY